MSPAAAPSARASPSACGAGVGYPRAEVGKPVDPVTGAYLVKVDSALLGATPDFPVALHALCDRKVLGLGPSLASERLHLRFPHGSILRTVLGPGGPYFFAARLRHEPEAVEKRRFWQARYLLLPRPGPWAAFCGLEALPFERYTHLDSRSLGAIGPIIGQVPGEIDPVLVAAVVCWVGTGVPVVLTGAVPERWFFELADAVCMGLPEGLQSVFQAGWGVTTDLAADLTLSHAELPPPNAAVWDTGRGSWTPPQVGPHGAWTPAERRPGEYLALHPAGAARWTPPPLPTPAVLVPLSQRAGLDRFRAPGRFAMDDLRQAHLSRWLATGAGEPRDLWACPTPEVRRWVHAGVLRALADPARRSRAVELVWRTAQSDRLRPLLGEFPSEAGAGGARLNLLVALAAVRPEQVLRALIALRSREGAAGRDARNDLPVGGALDRVLDASVRPESRGACVPMLMDLVTAPVEPLLNDWATAVAGKLAVLFVRDGDVRLPAALEGLAGLTGGVGCAPVLSRLAGALSLEPGDLALLQASPAARSAAWLILDRRWCTQVDERESLLPFVRSLGEPPEGLHVLLGLAAGRAVTPAALGSLVVEVQRGGLPAALLDLAAAAVLTDLDLLVRARSVHPSAWKPLVARLPAAVQAGLFGEVHESDAPRSDSVEVAARSALPSRQLLDACCARVAARAVLSPDGALFVLEGAWILNAALRSTPRLRGNPSPIDLIAAMAAGQLGELAEPSESTCVVAHTLLAAATVGTRQGWAVAAWPGARSAAAVRFLLDLAPAADLVPSVAQLVLLLGHRGWLRRHVTGAVRPSRGARFGVVLARFGSLDPEAFERLEFSATPLWAPFRGFPLSGQGSLRKALDVYAGSDPIRRVGLASEWLTNLAASDVEAGAIKLFDTVLLPMWVDAGMSRSGLLSLLDDLDLEQGATPPRRMTLWAPAELHEVTGATSALVLLESGVVEIADWYLNLMRQAWLPHRRPAVLAAFSRQGP